MATWLIIEDDQDMPEMLIWMFNAMGARGKTFRSGEALLAWADELKDDDDVPELALMDIRLDGELTGIDTAAQLRQHPLLADMPIVLMSAHRLSTAEADRVKHVGVDRLLQKPLPGKKELQAIFDGVLGAR